MNSTNTWIKVACVLLMAGLLFCCGPKPDGVEGELFSLEPILTIDTENNETAAQGLSDIRHFDTDSEGNIFIANLRSQESYIFKLDKEGSIKAAFGRRGQGPGEFQSPLWLAVSDQDEVFITDRGKVAVFSNSGVFIREFRIDREYQRVIPLNKDRYLAIANKMNEDMSQNYQVILCSVDMEELKILDSSKIESFQKAVKVNIIPTLVYWEASDSYIYTGNAKEYEIRVFDFEGTLLRRIRKESDPVLLSAEDRADYEERLKRYPPQLRESFFIPDAFPPFRDIVALGDKWLFLRTYEEANGGGSVFDIFNTNGKFMGRTELDGGQVKFKGDFVYCLKQKESGYRELDVYRMKWD